MDLRLSFLTFNGGTGKQLGAKSGKIPSWPRCLQLGPSLNNKIKTVPYLLIFHSQQAYYSLNSCCCPTSFNDICYFNYTPNSFLFKFSRKKAKSREQSLPFALGYWLSVCSHCCRDALFWICLSRSVFALFNVKTKLNCERVKLSFLFKFLWYCKGRLPIH